MSAPCVPVLPPLDSTYGVWLVSLFLETLLYGMGVLQVWIYYASMPTDSLFTQLNVFAVLVVETVQVVFFFRASYSRFVTNFASITVELVWFDSLQLLSAYFGAFFVQIFFAIRVYKLAKVSHGTIAVVGTYIIFALAFASLGTGIAQTAWTAVIGSFAELEQTKAVTTVQAATSLACDILITLFLCIFLSNQKGEIKKTNYLLERLIFEAINRGTLTALASGINLVLFLALPGTFWFFLGLAPSSKLYMNSMLATLNNRQSLKEKAESRHKDWNSLPMGSLSAGAPRSNVEFAHMGMGSKVNNHSQYALSDVSVVDSMVAKEGAMHSPTGGVHVQVERAVYVV